MEQKTKNPYWQALGLAWEFGYLIVIPLVLLALAGRFLDQRLHTSPWFFMGGLVISIIATTLLMIKKFSQLMSDIERGGKS